MWNNHKYHPGNITIFSLLWDDCFMYSHYEQAIHEVNFKAPPLKILDVLNYIWVHSKYCIVMKDILIFWCESYPN